MSHKITTLVYSKIIGSVHRKAILAYMADRASDDGSGVWCSKGTIAKETECGRSTVIRESLAFVEAGIITPTGSRKCSTGSTVEYRLNLEAIRALPDVKLDPMQSPSGTSPDQDRSHSGTPPVPERDPEQSRSGTQTTLEPPLNQEEPLIIPQPKKPDKQRLPDHWVLDDVGLAYARSKKIHDDDIKEMADEFHGYWSDRTDAGGKKSERGWLQCWKSHVRRNGPQFTRNRNMAGKAGGGGYGQGGSIASIVARRRASGEA